VNTIKTDAPLEHVVQYYKNRGFEKCKVAPTDNSLTTKVVFGGDLGPAHTTRLVFDDSADYVNTIIEAKTETRHHAIFEETLEIMKKANGFTIPNQTIVHNFRHHLARHPSSSSVFNNKNPGYHDTSEYVLLVRRYRDAVGTIQGS
jgi:hypothetical protein